MSLSDAIEEALTMRQELKAKGLGAGDLERSFEAAVRAVWPFTREWKYLCQTCGDYGLEMSICPGDATCGRPTEHLPHDYGKACWCSAGAKFRAKVRSVTDQLTDAASKPVRKQPSRFGR